MEANPDNTGSLRPRLLERGTDGLSWLLSRHRIDSIRGMACLLIVVVHSTNIYHGYHREIFDNLVYFNKYISDLRMPLFTFISGLIYANKSVESGSLNFIRRKGERLLIPFAALTFAMLALQTANDGFEGSAHVGRYFYYLLFGYAHLWFLQAIFAIFALNFLLNRVRPLTSADYVGLFLFSSCLAISFNIPLEIFSIGKAVELVPFFLLGVILSKYRHIVSRYRGYLLCAAICILLGIFPWISKSIFYSKQKSPVISFLDSISMLTIVFLSFPRMKLFEEIGKYSYSIFLFHFTTLVVFVRVFPANMEIAIPTLIATGIMVPIAIDYLIEKSNLRWTRIFLGKSFN